MRQRDTEALARKLLNGTPVSEQDLDFRRGFWRGAQWVLDNPDLAETAFKKAIERTERA